MGKKILQAEYEKFAARIIEETDKALAVAHSIIADHTVQSVGCVDRLTKKGRWNPPGGVVFLYEKGLLKPFMETRSGEKNGLLMGHLNCGYMRVISGLDTVRAQQDMFNEAKEAASQFNADLGTHFIVPPAEKNGSAAPYMRKGRFFSFR